MTNPLKKQNGQITWKFKPGDKYDVTGIDRNGKRFSMRFESWRHASGINLWNGSKWLVRNNKRHLLVRV